MTSTHDGMRVVSETSRTVLRDKGAGREYLVLGLTLAVLGVFSIAGTIWTSATVPPERQVDYRAIGTISVLRHEPLPHGRRDGPRRDRRETGKARRRGLSSN